MTKMPRRSKSKEVRASDWPARRMPTTYDVARLSGFSQMTVSRAFLDGAPIKQETRKRILDVAKEIGYYSNRAASHLASQRTRAFGVVVATLQDSVYLPLIDAVRSVFEKAHADFVLQTINYDKKREPQAIAALLAQRVQAILLPSVGHTPETAELIRSLPVPPIEVGNLARRPIHFAVGHSDFEAGYVATRRLIARGRRRIAIICGHVRQTTNARDRLGGYRLAHREAGIEIAEERIVQVDHGVVAGQNAATHLTQNVAFDGLVVAGEIWTPVTLLHLLKEGIRVPEDVAVVGIGEVELNRYLPVPLTYVSIPRAETGARAAELAIALSLNRDIEEPVIRLPVRLIESDSG
jgi:DNA-binding LacI/PurR family transcriptional regulator